MASLCCAAPVISYFERRVGYTRSCYVCCDCGKECWATLHSPVQRYVVRNVAVVPEAHACPYVDAQ